MPLLLLPHQVSPSLFPHMGDYIPDTGNPQPSPLASHHLNRRINIFPSLTAPQALNKRCSVLPTVPFPPKIPNRAASSRRHLVISTEHPHLHHSSLRQLPQGPTTKQVESAVLARTPIPYIKLGGAYPFWLPSYCSSSVRGPSYDISFTCSPVVQGFGASLSRTWIPGTPMHCRLNPRYHT